MGENRHGTALNNSHSSSSQEHRPRRVWITQGMCMVPAQPEDSTHSSAGAPLAWVLTYAGVLGICLGLEKGEMALSGLEFAPGHIFMAALIAGYEFLGLAEAPAVILLQSRSGLE